MWKKLSYGKKIKLLGAAAVLALVICYKLSIARTVAEYRTYKEHKLAASQPGAETPSGMLLEQKEKQLNAQLEPFVLDTLDNAKNLLSIVGNYCNSHNLILKDYVPYPVSPTDTLPVLTRYVNVEGAYLDCLKLVYELETRWKAGRVSAVQFKSYTDVNKGETHLNCIIYIQNLVTKLYDKN
ncbi:hypothetical protein [Longitalea arenae]|uniref:hypothetical protein n=1 Tax=Longitalea arenae TaxID=2812558 RepID=UPI00196819C1|nr:hypothetical protein [Longitalea arenae]